jgi:hypothetical protein
MAEPSNAAPWYAAYPEPRNKDPDSISRADLLQRFQAGQKSGLDFLLIDLRRTDHEVYIHTLEAFFTTHFGGSYSPPMIGLFKGPFFLLFNQAANSTFTDGKKLGRDDSRVVESSGSKFV